MNKRGFLDPEIIMSVGFVALFGLAISATVMGYIFSKKMDYSLPIWQLIVIIVVEFFASYFFIARDA